MSNDVNKWLISDLHLSDDNIRRYENRPFGNISDMDESIKANWNKLVGNQDKVFVLGDVCKSRDIEDVRKLICSLNGCKELILGNHDRDVNEEWWKDVGFQKIYEYPICLDGFYWLSHEPMYMNRNMPYVNIHGHIHGQYILSYNSCNKEQMINVCVEQIGYTPINFVDIKARFK